MKLSYRGDLSPDDSFAELAEPGERGADGLDGRDGQPGRDGADGQPGRDSVGWTYRGEWRRGRQYVAYDVVSHEGSSFLCVSDTKTEPPGNAWGTLAERGERGEAGLAGRGPRGFKGDAGEPGSGGGTSLAAFVADENIAGGQALIVSSAGHCELASASDITTAEIVGLSASVVGNGFAGLMQTGDVLTLNDWTDATGFASLSAGLAYYLSETPGMFATAPPTGEGKCVTYIGRTTDTQSLLIEVGQPIILSE